MLLPNTDAAGCARIGERIRRAIHEAGLVHASNRIGGCVTASIGGAHLPADAGAYPRA